MRPFFNFYGGKWLLAPKYDAPIHQTIIEPFAGSAGYSVRHYANAVRLYDVDPVIVGVWDYLIKAPISEINNLPDLVKHVDDLSSSVPQEARWLIGFWLNCGSAVPKKSMAKWKLLPHSNKGQLNWGSRVKERLAAQVGYIRHWTVECRDFASLDTGVEATWFVDPPYEVGGQYYRCKLTKDRYAELATWSQALTGQVIVCERPTASWLPFKPLCQGRSARYQFTEEAVWLGGVA